MSARMIEVLPNKSAIVRRSLELVRQRIQEAIATQGRCTVVLAGGSTPKPLYEALAQETIDWRKLHVFWGDERYVPSDHPDSNEGMARKAWLNKIEIPNENIHAMPTDAADPAIAAEQHEQHLKEFFNGASEAFPHFDIVLLGMGDDGHTASLFPHTPALDVCDRWVTVGSQHGDPRLTFTIPLINHAKTVIFLVAGANKNEALGKVLAKDTESVDSKTVPARYISPQQELWWLLDAAADGGQGYDHQS